MRATKEALSSGVKVCAYAFGNKLIAWEKPANTPPTTKIVFKRAKIILLLFIIVIFGIVSIIYVTLIVKSADSGLMGLKSIP